MARIPDRDDLAALALYATLPLFACRKGCSVRDRFLSGLTGVLVFAAADAHAFEQFCKLYEGPNYGGRSIRFESDAVINFEDDPVWNKKASSVQIGDDCQLAVSEETPGKRESADYFADQPDLGFWNDRIAIGGCYCADD
jgi:hypothetical protein